MSDTQKLLDALLINVERVKDNRLKTILEKNITELQSIAQNMLSRENEIKVASFKLNIEKSDEDFIKSLLFLEINLNDYIILLTKIANLIYSFNNALYDNKSEI